MEGKTTASRDPAGNTTVPGLIVPDLADKLARRVDGMGPCRNTRRRDEGDNQKRLETEKKSV